MTILERLKLELSNQKYFTDDEYIQFLNENDLTSVDEYDKSEHQKALLLTVLSILEAVANDIDTMTTIQTEFSNTTQAYKFLENRIQDIKDRISAIPDNEEQYSCFSLMFTN